MGTVTVAALVAETRRLLQDESNVAQRWTDTVLIGLLNEAALAIVRLLPQANSKIVNHTLAPGVRQVLPADAVSLLSVMGTYNTGTTNVPYSISTFDLAKMDAAFPSWRATPASSRTLQYAPDPHDLFAFYVYPPSSGAVVLQYAAVPTTMTLGGTFPLADIFAEPATHYAAYKALYADSDNERNAAVAATNRQAFYSLLAVPDPLAPKRGS